MYPILVFSNKNQLDSVKSGEKQQVTIKEMPVKTGDMLKTCFGFVKVTGIMRLWGCCKIQDMRGIQKESWAKQEGFENFAEADEWFRGKYGKDWQEEEFNVVKFQGDWIEGD